MAVLRSQNGWSAGDRSVIARYTIPGTDIKVALRQGDVSVVLLDWLAWWHDEIEPLVRSHGVYGYAERPIRGSHTTLSNHMSGTAVDANATEHPLAVVPERTFTAEQIRKIRARLRMYRGVLRWGGDYKGRKDGMHTEIVKGAAAVRAVADEIRAGRLGRPAAYAGAALDTRWSLPTRGVAVYGHDPLDRASIYNGSESTHQRAIVARIQAKVGAAVDGIYGPATQAQVAQVARVYEQTRTPLDEYARRGYVSQTMYRALQRRAGL